MVQITIIDNQTRIGTDDVEIFIEGNFELKKKTPVAGTTDAVKLNGKIINSLVKDYNFPSTSDDKLLNNP